MIKERNNRIRKQFSVCTSSPHHSSPGLWNRPQWRAASSPHFWQTGHAAHLSCHLVCVLTIRDGNSSKYMQRAKIPGPRSPPEEVSQALQKCDAWITQSLSRKWVRFKQVHWKRISSETEKRHMPIRGKWLKVTRCNNIIELGLNCRRIKARTELKR